MAKARVTIPKVFLDAFTKEPRLVLEPSPGLWPVDARLIKSGLLQNLIDDKDFMNSFEVMIVPR